ncbi:OmpR family two-component system response regulator [Sphingopyxis fribergensis]|uniref:OmpR family two-component system response regulator n=1 Tax=Sphingopyxis fribergensis TaxID=1515612 RepID=A0A0A7PH68_9SPHN|nr:response regulator transcription factor [Sphingopyxis fribergensis]AJA08568.1 OmpR family two-component system response regulator [Sphingopyxis fribergensis]
MRVLIIEDNSRLAELISHGIAQHGFSGDGVESIDDAEAALISVAYDAVILDLGLPDGDGLEWLRRERPGQPLPPILILTARDGMGDRVAGLDAGADDYLVKPVEIEELAARLRALLRRPGARSLPVIRAGKLAFDVAARTARSGNHAIELTRREADLLELLIRRAGAVVRRSSIEEALYRFDEPVTPNAVEAIVSRLRHKLSEADYPDRLITVRGMGYLLRDYED